MGKIILYVFLGLLALLLLLLLIPMSVHWRYHGTMTLTVSVWGIPFRIRLQERVGKMREEEAAREKKTGLPEWRASVNRWCDRLREDGAAATRDYLVGMARLAGTTAGRLFSILHITQCRLAVFVSGKDAAATAQLVGAYCSVIYPAATAVESVISVRGRHITVSPDFLAEKSRAEVEIRFHAVPLALGILIFKAIHAYQSLQKNPTKQEEMKDGK